MNDISEFYKQKSLNELTINVASNQYLTTEQIKMINMIIDGKIEMEDLDEASKMNRERKEKRALQRLKASDKRYGYKEPESDKAMEKLHKLKYGHEISGEMKDASDKTKKTYIDQIKSNYK